MATLLNADWVIYVEVIYFVFIILVALRIIYDTNSISKTLAYLLLILFIPFFGVFFYFSFGINYRKRKMYSKKLKANDKYNEDLLYRIKAEETIVTHDLTKHSVLMHNQSLVEMLANTKTEECPLFLQNDAEILENGETFFLRLLHDLKSAKKHIHIEYYIFENDSIGKEIESILIQKVKEGVEVRFIYDDFGSASIRKNIVRNLKKNGVEAYPFNKIILLAFANRVNYRNHRKIVVIDGKIGYTGGINISDRYDNRQKNNNDFFWRDTHLRIEGTAVYGLQYVFLADWNFCSKQSVSFTSDYFPKVVTMPKNSIPIQIVPSGPDSDVPIILYSVLKMIQLADKEVLITTPYYIPDDSLQLTIKMAVLSGKKVKLLLPGITDSNLVKWASESYFQELLEVGVEIYLYKKGFIHAKTIVTDTGVSSIGTCNLDHRSFDLNFEVNAILYDEEFADKMQQMFYRDCKDAIKLDLTKWNKRSKWQQLKNSFIRLLSPLL